MAGEVAERRAAEAPEVAPGDREVGGMKRPRLARPEPEVPVEALRNRHRLGGPAGERRVPPLRPDPGVHFADRPDRAAPEPLAGLSDSLRRMPLIAHLRGDFGLFGDLGHTASLPNVMRQRLLA